MNDLIYRTISVLFILIGSAFMYFFMRLGYEHYSFGNIPMALLTWGFIFPSGLVFYNGVLATLDEIKARLVKKQQRARKVIYLSDIKENM